MADVLRPVQLTVEKDLSGGVRIGIGGAVGLLSPEQTVEFALVLLKTVGVEVNLGPQFQLPKQRMFRAG